MNIQSVGSVAREILAQRQEARVLGVTSRGVFVHMATGWVLFLSKEGTRGPLTINLGDFSAGVRGLRMGDRLATGADGLWSVDGQMLVSTEGAEVWQAGPLPEGWLDIATIHDRLAAVEAETRLEPAPFTEEEQGALAAALRTRQACAVVDAAGRLLGRGAGLTPAGDDRAIGLLLALNRWGARLFAGMPVGEINQGLTALAWQSTTSLSASLIACAAQGQADERLVQALDGIAGGTLEAGQCAVLLKRWGSTSGACALAGIGPALRFGLEQA